MRATEAERSVGVGEGCRVGRVMVGVVLGMMVFRGGGGVVMGGGWEGKMAPPCRMRGRGGGRASEVGHTVRGVGEERREWLCAECGVQSVVDTQIGIQPIRQLEREGKKGFWKSKVRVRIGK